MKKTEDIRPEYRREDLGKGVRGKHYAAFQKGSNLVLLTPELAKIFPTNESVNAALASLVGVARSAVTKTRRTSATTAKRSSANTRQVIDMIIPVSHSSDPDLQKVPQALLRAGEKARQLAKQTGTKFVVRQASASALAKRK